MNYKKLFILIIIILICILVPNHNSLCTTQASIDEHWVDKAFHSVSNFFKEDFSKVDILKLDNWFVPIISTVLKMINRVLIVALFGLSAIALSYCGIQYIFHADNPANQNDVRNNIRTTFIGMGYGFGAYIIWYIAMQIVQAILGFVKTY